MKKVLIIGKRGFIGKSLNKFLKLKHNVKLISFKEALNFKQIDKYNFIINSSINRSYIEKKYNKKFDNDLKIAERINNIKTIYVFLSSRKVYKAKQNIRPRVFWPCSVDAKPRYAKLKSPYADVNVKPRNPKVNVTPRYPNVNMKRKI